MDAELHHRLKYELDRLAAEREHYMRQLQQCNGREDVCLLVTKQPGSRKYYYAKRKGGKSEKPVYLGSSKRPEVAQIKQAHYMREAIKRLDQDIQLLTKLVEGFVSCDRYAINEALPEVYRCNVAPMSQAYAIEGAEWKKEKLDFQAKYPENYPENKTERASDGVMVKTVSELVLYERVISAGLFAIYELPLVMKDYGPPMYPDLTVLSPIDMKSEIIIEYVGRLDLPQYRESFARRVNRYISNGYIPGVNLFFVFGDRDGHIDSMQINRVIADICGR